MGGWVVCGGGVIFEGHPVASPCHHLRSHLQLLSPHLWHFSPHPPPPPTTPASASSLHQAVLLSGQTLASACQSRLPPPGRAALTRHVCDTETGFRLHTPLSLWTGNICGFRFEFSLPSATVWSFQVPGGGTILLPYRTRSIFKRAWNSRIPSIRAFIESAPPSREIPVTAKSLNPSCR